MKLSVLVPSEEYKSYAGARIRYARVEHELACRGVELTTENIGQFDPTAADCDGVLISKCHHAQSLVMAAAMSDRGKLVGVDLFDDYFSQATDARLVVYRNWLSQLVEMCDFALCSTERMADVVRAFRSELPTHVMNDPTPVQNTGRLSAVVARKLSDGRSERRIGVSWFGIGDNRYFPVGLADLSSHGALLKELTRSGMDVELTILTNRRALNADGLSLIRALPIKFRVVEWSESAEREALEQALLAFLPVNAQPFSTAKSLNRAFTALSYGCQVLSAGYPLYEALDEIIYRNVGAFLGDLSRGSLRLRTETVGRYHEIVDNLASPEAEAERLGAFLSGVIPSRELQPLPISLIHGQSTRTEAQSLVHTVNGLSVASPFCSAPFDFDVVFRSGPTGLEMFVSQNASRRLLPHMETRLKGREDVRGTKYFCLPRLGETKCTQERAGEAIPFPVQMATYVSVMRQIEQRMNDAFGPCRTIISETSQLTFPLDRAA